MSSNRKLTGGTLMGHVAALFAVSMWGYSFVSSKVLLENGLGPVQIYVCRFVLAYLIVVCVSHRRLWASNPRDEGLFCLCGLLAGSLYFIAENTALEYTLTTNVSLLTSLSPLITALLVGLVYKTEKLGAGTWAGSIVALLGVGCVVFNSSASMEVRPLGDFLSLAAAFSWSVYSLILRRLNANYDVWFISRKTFFYGVLTAIPFLFFERDSVNPLEVMHLPEVYGNLLFLGVGASTIAYVLWALTVKNLGAVRANNYMYFQSIVTLVVSALVLGEHVSAIGYIGIALIIGGLWAGDNINKIIARRKAK
ncbi:MAG: DMT family transporter [Muribaculaceae bacterium]|nr:DMT family transporter [Muribaculaceae bacterium]